ncbi:MAG: hypothetical protein J6037_03570 [Bacteroidales bacterium]|nr:hypothetical protein [Bacteroidales bacterium]
MADNNQNGKNGIAIAGFVLSLVALFSSTLPVARWIVWVLGFIFSIVGLTKKPRGFAVAGLIISLFGLMLILFLATVIIALLGGLIASM